VRVIAGEYKGRRLQVPSWEGLRPTSDKLRETLFNVLAPSIGGARVLDGYAGTGAVGIEALSRGAAHVTFVERDAHALAALRANVAHCGVEEACAIIRDDFLRVRRLHGPFDLVLLDPPYDLVDLPAVVDRVAAWTAPAGRVVLEHSRRRATPEQVGPLTRSRLLTAGDSALSFYVTP